MIRSFKCQETETLFRRQKVRKIPANLQRVALRKLRMLDAATSFEDLKIPPGNYLEKLKDDRQGQYSIRINDQWRICFRFHNSEVYEVEIVDYH